MLFLRITAVESLRIRGLQNSSARTCESNKGVFSYLGSLVESLTFPKFSSIIFVSARAIPTFSRPANLKAGLTLHVNHRDLWNGVVASNGSSLLFPFVLSCSRFCYRLLPITSLLPRATTSSLGFWPSWKKKTLQVKMFLCSRFSP